MRTNTLATLLLATGLAGCGAEDPSNGDDETFADDSKADGASGTRVCATQHNGTSAEGDKVVICEALFSQRPLVKLPADKVASGSASSTLYAAISLAGQTAVVDRNGVYYTLVDAAGKPVDSSKLPTALHMPSHRALYTLYKLSGVISEIEDPYSHEKERAIHVTSGKPLVLLDGKAIDGAFVGAWEGTVSRRTADDSFDSGKPVPMRVTFRSLSALSNLQVWDSGKTLKDGTRFAMVGTVDNFSTAVRGSDGKCLAALSSLGEANPWKGATKPDVRLYRFPGMHFAADEVVVFDYPVGTVGLSQNGMEGLRITHPAALIQVAPSSDWTSMQIFPHSRPNGHALELTPVTGGGGGC